MAPRRRGTCRHRGLWAVSDSVKQLAPTTIALPWHAHARVRLLRDRDPTMTYTARVLGDIPPAVVHLPRQLLRPPRCFAGRCAVRRRTGGGGGAAAAAATKAAAAAAATTTTPTTIPRRAFHNYFEHDGRVYHVVPEAVDDVDGPDPAPDVTTSSQRRRRLPRRSRTRASRARGAVGVGDAPPVRVPRHVRR